MYDVLGWAPFPAAPPLQHAWGTHGDTSTWHWDTTSPRQSLGTTWHPLLPAAGQLAGEKIPSTKERELQNHRCFFFMGKQLRPAACSGRGKSWDISDSPQPVSLAVSALSFCDTLQQRPHTARWPQDAFLPPQSSLWERNRTHIRVFLVGRGRVG